MVQSHLHNNLVRTKLKAGCTHCLHFYPQPNISKTLLSWIGNKNINIALNHPLIFLLSLFTSYFKRNSLLYSMKWGVGSPHLFEIVEAHIQVLPLENRRFNTKFGSSLLCNLILLSVWVTGLVEGWVASNDERPFLGVVPSFFHSAWLLDSLHPLIWYHTGAIKNTNL